MSTTMKTLAVFSIVVFFTLHVSSIQLGNLNMEVLKKCFAAYGIPDSAVVFRNDARYAEFNQPWQLKPSTINPFAFVLPQTESHVAATVRCCKPLKVRVVPKSGGHSFEKYSYGDNSSVVIDLRLLNEVKVNSVEETAIIGPGNLNAPLMYQLWADSEVLVPVTNCPAVGISTVLGGGLGAFEGTYGAALDNILQIRVVLANGEVVRANSEEHQDLYWAMRGGGTVSFGIATQYLFRTHPTPAIVYEAMVMFTMEQLAAVLNVWQNFLNEEDKTSNVTTKVIIPNSADVLLRFTDVSGTSENFEKFRPLLPQPMSVTESFRTYPEYILYWAKFPGMLNAQTTQELNTPLDMLKINRSSDNVVYMKPKSFYVQQIIGDEGLSQFQTLLQEMPSTVNVFLDGSGGAIRSIGVNETAFVHRGPTLYCAIATYMNPSPTPTEDAIGVGYVQKFFDFGVNTFGSTESYQNDIDGDLPDYLERYYGQHVEKLVRIKRKYDPANFFYFPQSIPTRI